MASQYNRFTEAYNVRLEAATLAKNRPHPIHLANTEELRYRRPFDCEFPGQPSHIASYTKGLPHDPKTGLLIKPNDFQTFIRALDAGDEFSIREVPLGPQIPEPRFISGIASTPKADGSPTDVRAWESMAAGNTYDLEGPDAHAVTMPPAPALDSKELVYEISESYWMALVRDVPFTRFDDDVVRDAVRSLNQTEWIRFLAKGGPLPPSLSDAQRKRLRKPFTIDTVFRGVTKGDLEGPYLSQFMLIGNSGIANGNKIEDGFVQYGAHRVDQKVRAVEDGRDYMTTFKSFVDVQNGADVRGREVYSDGFRFITTPRDLTTYVHFDALYQAYLNACLILLGMKVPFDKGLPFQLDDDVDKQQTFATFGGPHILSLVTEVATRALKAVRFQKYNVHRRLRPEAVGGLIEYYHNNPDSEIVAGVKPLYEALDKDMLNRVSMHNESQNKLCDGDVPRMSDFEDGESSATRLLPMAFPEGSPMHPSYGAGHAAVAGACVTVLKAFFDHGYELRMPDENGNMVPFAFVPTRDGQSLKNVISEYGNKPLTVEGELNKVCSNISIGRNWAGVHYFTDYRESITLGEKIAIGILEEQKLTYGENFSMTVPLFDGTVYRI
ncbi:Vanadium-dependent bromoperoxidase [Gracilariopsis chorda]|uniref:Vanadium-dependent bromoperoxidase n=1 Tax=Gracilariopsis chorda TaxID=448386 RepID=A0A2V3ILP4_9FLOR|nr:Vanadium-dependent bromoperoxidase [Gracilariopsis chorda]|eukprot:PXF43005.1 Vanadium-dependent bromoperoxidase [Gracilariopsis chorda]